MAGMPRLRLFVVTAVCLGACTSEQGPLSLSLPMDHSNTAIVRKVQIALRDRGYYAGGVDGFLGQDTAFGIQRFQVDQCQRVKPVVDRTLLVSLRLAND